MKSVVVCRLWVVLGGLLNIALLIGIYGSMAWIAISGIKPDLATTLALAFLGVFLGPPLIYILPMWLDMWVEDCQGSKWPVVRRNPMCATFFFVLMTNAVVWATGDPEIWLGLDQENQSWITDWTSSISFGLALVAGLAIKPISKSAPET